MSIGMVLILVILCFAIWRIRKFSRMLVESQIFANECLMISHLAAFATLTINSLVLFTFAIVLNNITDEETVDNIFFISIMFVYLAFAASFAVILTMMIMFLKHDTRLLTEA